jgi:hypothetical protein
VYDRLFFNQDRAQLKNCSRLHVSRSRLPLPTPHRPAPRLHAPITVVHDLTHLAKCKPNIVQKNAQGPSTHTTISADGMCLFQRLPRQLGLLIAEH